MRDLQLGDVVTGSPGLGELVKVLLVALRADLKHVGTFLHTSHHGPCWI